MHRHVSRAYECRCGIEQWSLLIQRRKRKFHIKRIYDEPAKSDGFRILVDRLWPRGVSKAAAKIDLWAKILTPSSELRKWFHADKTRHDEFVTRYTAELEDRREKIKELVDSLDNPTITLVTSTKEIKQGHVAVLQKFLEG